MTTTINAKESLGNSVLAMTPQIARQRLLDGNKRFVAGMRSVEPMLAHLKMPNLAAQGQKPFAIVLTCSDSRSPVEMIFDQGLGDLFVVRVAGNVVAPSLLASIEFAAANFGSVLITVLGHTLCGAVNATIGHHKNPSQPLPSPHLEELVGRIRPAVEAAHHRCAHTESSDLLRESTLENVQRSMRLILEQSQIVRDLAQKGQLTVEGAMLDISNGEVTFIS